MLLLDSAIDGDLSRHRIYLRAVFFMVKPFGLLAIDRQNFFKTGYLLIDDMLSQEQCDWLFQELNAIWQRRCESAEPRQAPIDDRLLGGDLWRACKPWQLHLRHAPIGQLARQLWSRATLRLLFDQIICPPKGVGISDSFARINLQSFCELQGLVGGVVVCLRADLSESCALQLQAPQSKFQTGEQGAEIAITSRVGRGVFVGNETRFRVECSGVNRRKGLGSFWMCAAFGEGKILYAHNPQNPKPLLLLRPKDRGSQVERGLYPPL